MRLVFVVLLLLAMSQAISITSWETDKDVYEPGDSGYITLHVSLTHNLKTGERLIRFNYVNVESYSSVGNIDIVLGDMDQNEITVAVPIEVGENLSEGLYSVVFKVSGIAEIESGGKTRQDIDSASTVIPLKVVSKPVLKLDLQPKTLGKTGETTIQICNEKGKARAIRISSMLYIEGGGAYIPELEDCISKKVSYDASGFQEGTTVVDFDIAYKDAIGDAYTTTFSIPITISKDATRFVIRQDDALPHMKNSVLKLNIENRGNDAEDVRIRPTSSTYLTLLKENEADVGDITKDSSKTVNLDVFTSLNPGVNTVSFTVFWKENGEEKGEQIDVPVTVEAEDSIEVYLEATPIPLTQGGEHTISVVVANKATYSMSGVSVGIDSNSLEVLEVEKRRFIGSLESDDFSSQQFKVRVRDDAPPDSNATVSVTFKDPSGKEHTKTTTMPIIVKERIQGDIMPLIIGLVVIVAVAAGAFLILRKKK